LTAIDDLLAGYRRFREGYFQDNRERLTDLAAGQSPRVAMVACCDSRVDPAVITDSAPGELFVIRNVANLVPPCEGEGIWHGTSAALQFAVCGLDVEHLVVLGHARCGGIRALLEGRDERGEDSFVADWMRIAAAARRNALERDDLHDFDQRAHACELDAIGISLANLASFPWIRERIDKGSLELHGWYYDLTSGELLCRDPVSGRFTPAG